MFLNRNVKMFPSKNAVTFPSRFQSRSVRMFQDKSASRFPSKCPSKFQSRSATKQASKNAQKSQGRSQSMFLLKSVSKLPNKSAETFLSKSQKQQCCNVPLQIICSPCSAWQGHGQLHADTHGYKTSIQADQQPVPVLWYGPVRHQPVVSLLSNQPTRTFQSTCEQPFCPLGGGMPGWEDSRIVLDMKDS